jgi:phosphate transport system substrate-binding protein
MRATVRRFVAVVVVGAALAGAAAGQELRGEVKADGSSTVYLITEAMATAFKRQHPGVSISVGISGTGGGFKKFINGETDLQNASRPITADEKRQCQEKGVEFVEMHVAWDGLTVVIHPKNTWAEKMTAQQLRKIWHPDTAAKKWSDVEPGWPAEEIRLFGAGPDSGTFDSFTESINGKARVSRKDYEASEDDNVTARGVGGNQFALGYFGLAYFESNKDTLKAVAITKEPGAPFVLPSVDTVRGREYQPLSRELYIYVKKSSLQRPEIQEFVRFYVRSGDVVTKARYIPITQRQQAKLRDRVEAEVKALAK